MPLQTASGEISRERFMRGSSNFTWLSGITGRLNQLYMTSRVASGRLKNANKYWTEVVMRKTGPGGQRVKYFGHCLTQIHQVLSPHPCRQVHSHTGHDVISYFRSALIKVRKMPLPAALGRILVASCLPHPLVCFLFRFQEPAKSNNAATV